MNAISQVWALRSVYAAWARDRGLVREKHDAYFAGKLFWTRVTVDTGVRDSGLYEVVVWLGCSRAIPRLMVATDATFARAASMPGVRSVRAMGGVVEIRLAPGTAPRVIERAIVATVESY